MKPVAWVISGIIVLAVAGCGGGRPQVEERPEVRPAPSPFPTVAATPVPTATVPGTGTQLSIAVAPVRDDIPEVRSRGVESLGGRGRRLPGRAARGADSRVGDPGEVHERGQVQGRVGIVGGAVHRRVLHRPGFAGHRPHGATGERAPLGRLGLERGQEAGLRERSVVCRGT